MLVSEPLITVLRRQILVNLVAHGLAFRELVSFFVSNPTHLVLEFRLNTIFFLDGQIHLPHLTSSENLHFYVGTIKTQTDVPCASSLYI